MDAAFFAASAIALAATVMAITRTDAVHALLYFIVSLLGVAVVFYTLGASFAAVLEVIIYAGAIVVLFVFVVMMLNLGREAAARERGWLRPAMWAGPSLLALLLFVEIVALLAAAAPSHAGIHAVEARQVGAALFGPYLLAVELASMLLLAGLVGAYHLGRDDRNDRDGRNSGRAGGHAPGRLP